MSKEKIGYIIIGLVALLIIIFLLLRKKKKNQEIFNSLVLLCAVISVIIAFVSVSFKPPSKPDIDIKNEDSELVVSISSSDPNIAIYYTTDGSRPTTNSLRYKDKIKFNKDVIIKAFAKDIFAVSEIAEETGIIDKDKVSNTSTYNKELTPTLGSTAKPTPEPTKAPTNTPTTTTYFLTGSYTHLPNIDNGDYIIGGVWKLQGIHKNVTSFTQRVRVYSQKDNSIECPGYAKYGTAWTENDNGEWSE